MLAATRARGSAFPACSEMASREDSTGATGKRPHAPDDATADATNKRSCPEPVSLDQNLVIETSNGLIPCCSAILAYASTYFKTALTTPIGEATVDADGRRRISMREFTRQDVGLLVEIVTLQSAISVSNVHTLLPLLDFLGMEAALRQADGVICAALSGVDVEEPLPAKPPAAPKMGWWTRARTSRTSTPCSPPAGRVGSSLPSVRFFNMDHPACHQLNRVLITAT